MYLSIKESMAISNWNVKEEAVISIFCRILHRLCNPYAEGLWEVVISCLVFSRETVLTYRSAKHLKMVKMRQIPSSMPPFCPTGKELFFMSRQIELPFGGPAHDVSITNDAERRTIRGLFLSLKDPHHYVTFHCWSVWSWGAWLEFSFFKYNN